MTSTTDDGFEESRRKVIKNEYIMEHIFSFLRANDIKNCRIANTQWRNIGTKYLRKRSHVVFDFSNGSGSDPFRSNAVKAIFKKNEKKMKEVVDYCKENPEKTPIASFTFQNGELAYFQMLNYLDDVRSYMKELKLVCGIYHELKNKINVDITPKIPAHLTKLHLEMYSHMDITLAVYFDQISFVKDIYLDNCIIVVDTNEKRLSPNSITLGPKNKYIKNGTKVKFLVNKSFDLTLTKQINLNDENLIIDFSDWANDQVERNVRLKNITVRNWQMCNWKMQKFSLDGIDFPGNNSIEIEELKTDNLTIDLSKIYNPASLLKLYCLERTNIAEAPFFLPNLVDVTLGNENCVAKLPYFKNNQNISKMTLQTENTHYGAMTININDLPKGIKDLSLGRLRVHGQGEYKLKTRVSVNLANSNLDVILSNVRR